MIIEVMIKVITIIIEIMEATVALIEFLKPVKNAKELMAKPIELYSKFNQQKWRRG